MKKLFICIPLLLSLLLSIGSCHTNPLQTEAEPVYQAKAMTGEGAVWHPGRSSLFWVDIEGKTLYEFKPETGRCEQWIFHRMVTAVAPESDTTVVIALQNEVMRLHLKSRHTSSIAAIPDRGGKVRTSDGKCDPSGRFWIGTVGRHAANGVATLYRITADGHVAAKLQNVAASNGMVWSSNRKYMYYNDGSTGKITRYRYNDVTGEILYDGVAVSIPKEAGMPHGMAIDRQDNLWVALWDGFGVSCYNPYSGELLAQVKLPVPRAASCAFGGEEMNELYITTARAGLTHEQLEAYPLSGSLFHCRLDVEGAPVSYCFKERHQP